MKRLAIKETVKLNTISKKVDCQKNIPIIKNTTVWETIVCVCVCVCVRVCMRVCTCMQACNIACAHKYNIAQMLRMYELLH